MATFLELCQKSARNSGVIQGVLPTTVTGQTGLLGDLVAWVADSWVEIQAYRDWDWMRSDWTGVTISGVGNYTASDLLITDLAKWMVDRQDYQPLTAYLTSGGVASEAPLRQVSYEAWRHVYTRGTQTNGQPGVYAISPMQKLCLGPAPDDVYTLKGEYYRKPQRLTANTDTPTALPEHLHDIIMFRALMRLGANDGNATLLVDANGGYNRMLRVLEDGLPQLTFGWGSVA